MLGCARADAVRWDLQNGSTFNASPNYCRLNFGRGIVGMQLQIEGRRRSGDRSNARRHGMNVQVSMRARQLMRRKMAGPVSESADLLRVGKFLVAGWMQTSRAIG